MLRVDQVKCWFQMIPLQGERDKAALHLVPPPTLDAAIVPAAEEQRLLLIGVKPDVVGRSAVRLHDADRIYQSGGGLHLGGSGTCGDAG